MWETEFKDKSGGSYEYSAIKKDNTFGHQSWGWGGDNKIIVFGSGIGGNSIQDKAEAKRIIEDFVHMLNTRK